MRCNLVYNDAGELIGTVEISTDVTKIKVAQDELQRSLDTAKILGGVGMHKTTAERVSREVEVVMLLKFGL